MKFQRREEKELGKNINCMILMTKKKREGEIQFRSRNQLKILTSPSAQS
jgi:hypothetical protein